MILVVDNYDSFTYNLVQYLGELGAELVVRRNDAVTLDDVCDELIIWGTPDKVADDVLNFRETTGDFGTLLYAGKDWKDPELGRQSMILAAEKVLPLVNHAIASESPAQTASQATA